MHAEYFQPKYEEIMKRIEKYIQEVLIPLKIWLKWKKGFEVGSESYLEYGKKFVRVSDFSKYGIERTNKYISEDLFKRLKEKFQPQSGEILFTKDGTDWDKPCFERKY